MITGYVKQMEKELNNNNIKRMMELELVLLLLLRLDEELILHILRICPASLQ